jgi:V8-like Glu-specific endopeptidase
VRITPRKLFSPDANLLRSDQVMTPEAVGSIGAHYTSTRVFPMFTGTAAPFSADRAYPYITIGKLFFTIGRDPYVCSASVIQHRIVATAGHCVHSGTSAGFHNNWVFVPAFRDGTAPLLTWNWRAAIVTNTWASGGGGVPNAADYAMIEFGDQRINGRAFALGDLTGWLGWQTRSLSANHTSKLGYPCNLDSCQKMQNVTSGAFRNTSPNNVEYGSDAEGGSSGGPWVQNFQQLQSGGASGQNVGSNRVVGVTSYGYVPNDYKVQGASIPDGRWVNLFNTLCGRVSGNCL